MVFVGLLITGKVLAVSGIIYTDTITLPKLNTSGKVYVQKIFDENNDAVCYVAIIDSTTWQPPAISCLK